MKKIIQKYSCLISVVVSVLVAIGLKVESKEIANDMIYLIFTIGISVLIYHNLKSKDKRLWIISAIVGVIFSICYYLGDIQNLYMHSYVPTSKRFFLYSVIKMVSYFVIFANSVFLLFEKMPKIINKIKTDKKWEFFTNNKKSFALVALIFFVSYIPFFLHYYPGNVNTDSVGSLYQITGISKFTNFQPILYTLILGGLWNLGKFVFGSSVAGIAVYSLFQMICTSLVFSYVLYYMAKRNISLKWRILTFLFLLLNPLNGWFVVRCEKGMLFHISFILVVLGIIDIIYEKEKFFKNKWKVAGLVLITLIMIFIRNNGIYALVLSLPFLIWACKKIWKQVLALFGGIIVCTLIIQGPVFKAINISYSNAGEALSVPIQAFARVSKYADDRLSEDDKNAIDKYFRISHEDLANIYEPWRSDATKSNFLSDEFSKDKKTLILKYLKFAIKYPVQTVTALVLNTGNNYSPNFKVWGIIRDYGTETQDAYGTLSEGGADALNSFVEKYPLHGESIVKFEFLQKLNDILAKENISVISNFIDNIGFYFWIILLCVMYCIYKKQYEDIVMILPILGLWLTAIAAPMTDIRYIYPMFLTAPIFIGIIGKNSAKNEIVK